MIVYSVMVSINPSIKDDWLKWMKSKHIPKVMGTKLFNRHEFFKHIDPGNSKVCYTIQYWCNSMEDLLKYRNHYAPDLQKEHLDRYKGLFTANRVVMEFESK